MPAHLAETASRFALVGPGRAGRALENALCRAGWVLAGRYGRTDVIADAARDVDVVIIATPDAAVASVAAAIIPHDDVVVMHLAGALGTDALAGHLHRLAMHPLVSFTGDRNTSGLEDGAWFGVGASSPRAHAMAKRLIGDLHGNLIAVADADRARYHAAACIASNHLVALLAQVTRVAASIGVPFAAFSSLISGTLANAERLGAANALTGPVQRGDWETVARHVAALDESERATYLSMAAAAARLTPVGQLPEDLANGGNQGVPMHAVPEVLTTSAALRVRLDEERRKGRRIGFVPTMGYLHDGHGALIERAVHECDVTVVSVFVNPLQFGAGEDLESYPRDFARDVALIAAAGASIVFHPDVAEMYPEPVRTTVSVAAFGEQFEGAARPTHFAGVATVVAKLFSLVGPCRAYFGEKDFQQLTIVRRMVSDLSIPVTVVGCPTVREADGLARSSRNVYLTAEQRAAAPVLYQALLAGRDAILAGTRDRGEVEATMARCVAAEPLAALDYAAAVNADDLRQPDVLHGEVRLLIAARLGKPRLLDNLGVTVPAS